MFHSSHFSADSLGTIHKPGRQPGNLCKETLQKMKTPSYVCEDAVWVLPTEVIAGVRGMCFSVSCLQKVTILPTYLSTGQIRV